MTEAASLLHRDELPIDAALVGALIEREMPGLAGRPIVPLETAGSSNVMFRLGDDLLMRLPRQPGGGAGILKESRVTPLFAEALPVAVPEVIAVGMPGFGYPESWSVIRMLDGDHPSAVRPGDESGEDRKALAEDLAEVVLALRGMEVPGTSDESLLSYRGGALTAFDPAVRRNLALCRNIEGLDLDLGRAEALWEESLRLPGADRAAPDRWFHGDLVAENLLVADGRLTAVLDLGGVAVGDPTVDLHGAWEVLDDAARDVFALRVGCDEAEWLRGRAWALGIALGVLPYYWGTMPRRCTDRLAMIRNILND